jgi:hypothetical protein
MDLTDKGYDNVDWIHLARDRVQWLALKNTVMNFQFARRAGNFLTNEGSVPLGQSVSK